jgi:polyhydroxybutyrate depolymerase
MVVLAVSIVIIAGLVVWLLYGPTKVSPPALGAQIRDGALEHEGQQRTYQYYAPNNADRSAPLVLVLHGGTSNAEAMREMTAYRFDQLADKNGFIVVYPNAIGGVWHGCRSVDEDGPPDTAFLIALMEHFQSRWTGSRIYVAGFSNGGDMALRMALEVPERVDAVAAIAANLPSDEYDDCKPSSDHIRVMLVHGTDDPLVPYDGGRVKIFGVWDRGAVRSHPQTVEHFLKVAQLDGEPDERERFEDRAPSDGATVIRESWLVDGVPIVTNYVVRGGGHDIPHPARRLGALMGNNCADINAVDEIWRFFDATSPPRGQ